MAYLVEISVILSLLLAVLLRRNNYLHPLPCGLIDNGITVIATICKKVLCFYSFNQLRSFCAVSRDV